MSLSAIFDGRKIDDMNRWIFSGSSSPNVFQFPRCTGALLKPSGTVTRTITLESKRFPLDVNKTQIETFQHNLNELLIAQQNGTLIVDGISYTNVTPRSITQNIISNNEYFTYSINFELSKDQSPFRPALKSGVIRLGRFLGYPGAPATNGFPIFDNYEAGLNVQYGETRKQREVGDYGHERTPAGGVEVINLDCWMVDQETQDFQRYMADWLLDPLGKQGTLNLNGLTFTDAILVGVNCEQQVGASLKYTLEFNATLAC
jgi:hypothetical protein